MTLFSLDRMDCTFLSKCSCKAFCLVRFNLLPKELWHLRQFITFYFIVLELDKGHHSSISFNTIPETLNYTQANFSLTSGLQNGLSDGFGHSDLLGQEFNPQGLQSYPHDSSAFSNAATNGYTNNHSSPIQNHFGHDSSAFANTGANGFSKNPSSGYASGSSVFADAGSAFAKSGGSTPFGTSLSHQQSGLERAFSSMALEHRPSFQEASLPAASAFEERVQMLSAGSAGQSTFILCVCVV